MLKITLFGILIALFLKPSPKLTGTIWVHKVAEGCIDTLKIKANGKVIEYNCEMGYSFKGSYSQSKDTLIITEMDDSHSEDGGKTDYYISKYLIRKNSLYILGNGKLINDKWEYDGVRLYKSVWYKKIP